jgi:hypothetical protein
VFEDKQEHYKASKEQILVERVKWAQLIKLMHKLLGTLIEKKQEWVYTNQWKEWDS